MKIRRRNLSVGLAALSLLFFSAGMNSDYLHTASFADDLRFADYSGAGDGAVSVPDTIRTGTVTPEIHLRHPGVTALSFTRGLTIGHPYWQQMLYVLQYHFDRDQFTSPELADIFDLAHMVIKEVYVSSNQDPAVKQLEMQLVALTVLNRMRTVQRNPRFINAWGEPTVQSVILHPYQYSAFNNRYSRHVSSMAMFYTPAKWEQALLAAARVYRGQLDSVPPSMRTVVSFYNPRLCSPSWGQQPSVFQMVNLQDADLSHRFYRHHPQIPGALSGG